MQSLPRLSLRNIPVIIILLGSLASASFPAHGQASAQELDRPGLSLTLQADFQRASREFGVPLPILLAVSYDESRWEEHAGLPSTSGGYGVMHLTHVDRWWDLDARGDARLRAVHGDRRFHALDTAAALLGLRSAMLERSVLQNIRGGAALLARYARATTGRLPSRLSDWYGAVAEYSGSRDEAVALDFADAVYSTIRQGELRTTAAGQRVRLVPLNVVANRQTARPLDLRTSGPSKAECPRKLLCQFIPAAYAVNNPQDPTDYGNYNVANRPNDGLAIRYIVIHDTETAYDTTIHGFQNPARYASSNYVIRSIDGEVTQMVPNEDVSWHAGNYYVNMHAIGIEHEGVAVEGAAWYNEQLYRSSARLVRYLANRYHVPLDRAHIIGHDEVPGLSPQEQSSQHWDPGPYWDWGHYMELLKAPLGADTSDSDVITIDPALALNEPGVTYCFTTADCRSLPEQPANFVYLRSAPSSSAPLLNDAGVHGAMGSGTTRANDWGDKAVTGQEFYRVDQQGDWVGIDYGGQEAWFYDPQGTVGLPTTPTTLVTPKAGLASIPVYGGAYPESSAYPRSVPKQTIVSLQYKIPHGQRYVATAPVTADLYWAPTQTRRTLVKGRTKYYQIFFNHRFAFVRARDVDVETP